MNIFVVDKDPIIAARSLLDKHIVKMPLETAQLLSTNHRFLDGVESRTPRNRKTYILEDERETHALFGQERHWEIIFGFVFMEWSCARNTQEDMEKLMLVKRLFDGVK